MIATSFIVKISSRSGGSTIVSANTVIESVAVADAINCENTTIPNKVLVTKAGIQACYSSVFNPDGFEAIIADTLTVNETSAPVSPKMSYAIVEDDDDQQFVLAKFDTPEDLQAFEDTLKLGDITINEGRYRPVWWADSPKGNTVNCFAGDAEVFTFRGSTKVKDLKLGDMVQTIDNGFQPIAWIGSNSLSDRDLKASPELAPVRILAGALGANIPSKDLIISQQHRLLVSPAKVGASSDESEVLISAKTLTAHPGIFVDETITEVEYFHFLFDEHQIVFANGIASESMQTGMKALRALSDDSYNEIVTLFPEIRTPGYMPIPARNIQDAETLPTITSKNTLGLNA